MKRIVLSGVLFLSVFSGIYAQSTVYPSSSEIKAVLQPFIDNKELSGILTIVAKEGEVQSVDCVGYQNIAKRTKINSESLFWIASQSKPIAATAVMILVEKGKLNLDVPISTYLPEMGRLLVNREWTDNYQIEDRITEPVTLRHLLSHTSGMKWVAKVQESMGFIDVVPLIVSTYISVLTPFDLQPGVEYRYSNQGINIAAAAVEKVSGMAYEEFLQKYIFDPLGMKNTTFWPTNEQLQNLVTPYKKVSEKLEETRINQLQYPLTDRSKRFAEAAGGLFSTPVDLVKFYQMIANKGTYNGNRILQESSVIEMGKKQTGNNIPTSYGLGWSVSDDVMSHGGAYGTDSRVGKNNGFVVMYFTQEEGLDSVNAEAQRAFFTKADELFHTGIR